MSTTTLLSEVISMVKLRPKPSVRHARLRESVDVDNLENQDGHEMEVLKSPRYVTIYREIKRRITLKYLNIFLTTNTQFNNIESNDVAR